MNAYYAFALIWLGLIAFLMVAINAYRSRLEREVDERPIARIQRGGLIRYRKERPRVR